ncbi:MAG: hypothetical protein QOI84_1903, partial [Solirubrobacterales bacterium]|nr:hypothetical protein [Solirubrobacterales bacterium]
MAAWLPGVLLAIALLAPSPAGAVTVKAKSADSFVGSIGVGVHLSYTDTPYYGQFTTVKQRLQELGVRHVRDDLVPNRPDQYQALSSLAGVGIKSTLILGSPKSGFSVLDNQLIPTLKGPLAGKVDA